MSDLPASVRRFTALARVVDPGVPSNRFAMLIAVVGAGVAATFGGDPTADGAAFGPLSRAVAGGLGGFLAWAIARELDPDHTAPARYAGFAAVLLLLIGLPDVAALGALLLAVRVVTRSTGLRPTIADIIAMVALAWTAAGDPTGVVAAFAAAGALVWDTRLPVRAPSSSGLAGAIVLSAAVVSAVIGGGLFSGWEAPGLVAAGVFLAAMTAATRIGVTHVTSRADVTDELLHAERIQRARVLTGLTLAGTMVWVGEPSVAALAGGWAAFIAVGVNGLRSRRLAGAAAAALVLLTGGCATDDDPVATPAPSATPAARPSASPSPSPSPGPTPSPTPPPPPEVREHDDAADLSADLVAAERGIRDDSLPATHREAHAWIQQAAYRELAENPAWYDEVSASIPDDLARPFELNAEAQAQLHALTRPRESLPDHWTIVAPPPAAELRTSYETAAAEFGVNWTYLAAIHLVETRMGRIRGDSTAGARGPMQFIPSTWEAYGEGDIEDPTDAIRAAARYLVDHGAPGDMTSALWAYNHSDRYVTAVANYAAVMQAEPERYEAYHAWRVYYRLTTGSVVLEEGWSGSDA